MIIYYILLIIMTMLGSVASLFLKKASGDTSIIEMIKNKNLYIGGGLYISSAILNIWVLRYLDYSVVLPFTSFTYIWTMIVSYKMLKEKVTVKKISGIFFILLGAICVSI